MMFSGRATSCTSCFGLDLEAMVLVYPTVVGNPARFRILFHLPDGIDLTRHSLAWPNENDPDGSILKGLIEFILKTFKLWFNCLRIMGAESHKFFSKY